MYTEYRSALMRIRGNKKELIPIELNHMADYLCVDKDYVWISDGCTHSLHRYSKKDGSFRVFNIGTWFNKTCSGEDCIYAVSNDAVLKISREGEVEKTLRISIPSNTSAYIYDIQYHKGIVWVGHTGGVVKADSNLTTSELLHPRRKKEHVYDPDVTILSHSYHHAFYYCKGEEVTYEHSNQSDLQRVINYNGCKYLHYSTKIAKVSQIPTTIIEFDFDHFCFAPDEKEVWVGVNDVIKYTFYIDWKKKIYEILTQDKSVKDMTPLNATESQIELGCGEHKFWYRILREYKASSPEAMQALLSELGSSSI